MKLLLDTHAVIWALEDVSRLGNAARLAIESPRNTRLVSVGSVWELAIKISLGKLALSRPFRDWVAQAMADLKLILIPADLEALDLQIKLPFHHRDPFDRLLIAQAIVNAATLVTADPVFAKYPVPTIW